MAFERERAVGRARQERGAGPHQRAGVDAADAAEAAGGNVSGPFWPQPASNTATPRVVTATTTLVLDDLGITGILMTDADYHRLTGELLARVEATADRLLQDDVVDIDTQRTGGLLELAFPGGSKIVINTQPPLHEVWLAAKAGGFHYRYEDGRWLDTKDGSEFFAALSRHASTQAGKNVRF
jgi:CyaY protein